MFSVPYKRVEIRVLPISRLAAANKRMSRTKRPRSERSFRVYLYAVVGTYTVCWCRLPNVYGKMCVCTPADGNIEKTSFSIENLWKKKKNSILYFNGNVGVFVYRGKKWSIVTKKMKKKTINKLPAKRAHVKYAPRTCYNLGVPLRSSTNSPFDDSCNPSAAAITEISLRSVTLTI